MLASYFLLGWGFQNSTACNFHDVTVLYNNILTPNFTFLIKVIYNAIIYLQNVAIKPFVRKIILDFANHGGVKCRDALAPTLLTPTVV
jgi:hypothetical protein